MARIHRMQTRRALRLAVLGTVSAILPVGTFAWIEACHQPAPSTPNAGAIAERDQRALAAVPNAGSADESGCFDGVRLRDTWTMDAAAVQWSESDNRFEHGVIVNGQREGCWSVWHKDGLFDSGSSGAYANGIKVESAPSPLGDFPSGRDE